MKTVSLRYDGLYPDQPEHPDHTPWSFVNEVTPFVPLEDFIKAYTWDGNGKLLTEEQGGLSAEELDMLNTMRPGDKAPFGEPEAALHIAMYAGTVEECVKDWKELADHIHALQELYESQSDGFYNNLADFVSDVTHLLWNDWQGNVLSSHYLDKPKMELLWPYTKWTVKDPDA